MCVAGKLLAQKFYFSGNYVARWAGSGSSTAFNASQDIVLNASMGDPSGRRYGAPHVFCRN